MSQIQERMKKLGIKQVDAVGEVRRCLRPLCS
jgi:hypothetical protein